MTLTLDIADDFESIVDGLETISLRGHANGQAMPVEIADALRRSIRTYEAAQSNGRYLSSDVAWHFDCRRGTPEVGGVIIDSDGTQWRILDFEKQTLKNRWRCVCRENKIEGYLDIYVDIKRRSWTKAPDGTAVATYAT